MRKTEGKGLKQTEMTDEALTARDASRDGCAGEELPLLSIVVPCYNEEAAIPIFYGETTRVLERIADKCRYELIFVNDGSRDGTESVLESLAEVDERVTYLKFSRNFGKESALYAGLSNVGGDYVAIMDVDMQDPPSMIPEMLDAVLSDECDVAATRRVDRRGEPPIRSFFARAFYRLINKISDAEIVDGARDFRLMKREVADVIVSMKEYNRFSKGLFGWVGYRTKWLQYENRERAAGETKWSFWKLFKYALDGIINFSQMPLTIASWFGIFMTMFAFIAELVVVVRRLIFGDPVAGWASLVCIIVFVGGIQLFCLGIIGQYLAKLYLEAKGRPHYIIEKSNRDVKKIG